MSRTPARFTQADIARAIRAAKQCDAAAIELLPDRTIRINLAREAADQTCEPESEVVL
jgi:hypothetical protein